MTQQERIMQEMYIFARTDQCQLPENGPYSYICKSIYTRIRAVRPSTCNIVHAFVHFIRAPHLFQTLGWIGLIYGLMIGMGPKFSQYHPRLHPWLEGQGHGHRDLLFIVEVYSC